MNTVWLLHLRGAQGLGRSKQIMESRYITIPYGSKEREQLPARQRFRWLLRGDDTWDLSFFIQQRRRMRLLLRV